MKEVPTPDYFTRMFKYQQSSSRKEDKQAHVSEVIYCLRKSKLSRMEGEEKEFNLTSSLAIRRGLALEANLLRGLERFNIFVKGNIIASLDGIVLDDDQQPKYGVELKTRAITGNNPLGEHYISQVMLYEYVVEIPILLIVYSCFKTSEGSDKLQFFLTDEDDYKKCGEEWFNQMQDRAEKFLDSVFNEPTKLLPPDPQFDWECSLCNYHFSCPFFYEATHSIMVNSKAWGKPNFAANMVKQATGYDNLVKLHSAVKNGLYDMDSLLERAAALKEQDSSE